MKFLISKLQNDLHSSRLCTGSKAVCRLPSDSNLAGLRRNGYTSRRESVVALARRTKRLSESVEPVEDVQDEKFKAFLSAINVAREKHGRGTVQLIGESKFETLETFSSGSMMLDAALGGGYPIGRMVEVFGPESSGKTSLALHAIAEVQKTGQNAVFIDAEHVFNQRYAEKMGVDVKKLAMIQPDTGEQALELADEFARSGAVGLIVIDSVSALVPRAELEGEMGQPGMGLQARLLSSGLRKLVGTASRTNCTIFFINQLRMKIQPFGNPEVTSGGNALKFYTSVRIDVRKKEAIGKEREPDSIRGIKIRAKIVKNKMAPPYRECMLDLYFDSGIDAVGGLLDAAEKAGVVTKSGAHYSYGDQKLGHGREKAVEALKMSVELQKEIERSTRAALAQNPLPPDMLQGGTDDSESSIADDEPDEAIENGGLN